MTMLSLRVLLGIALVWTVPSTLAEIYRYTDKTGNIVLDRQGVPAEYVGQGYEVLSKSGQVIRVVPRALTPEEHQQRSRERQQQEADLQLLRLYHTEQDLDRAKIRKLNEVDGQISLAEGSLSVIQLQKSRVQTQAAIHERAGREVPEYLVTQVSDFVEDEQRVERQINMYKQQRTELAKQFEAQRERLRSLIDKQKD